MEKQRTNKTKEIHELYKQCKKVFEPSLRLSEEYSNIKDDDEKEFYIKMQDLFTQQKQREIIKKGVF